MEEVKILNLIAYKVRIASFLEDLGYSKKTYHGNT